MQNIDQKRFVSNMNPNALYIYRFVSRLLGKWHSMDFLWDIQRPEL